MWRGTSLNTATLAVFVLALNALAATLAASWSALLLAVAGCLSALFVRRAIGKNAATAAALVFVVPLFSRWFSPQVAFMTVDGRFQIAAAWITFAFVLAHVTEPRRGRVSATALFLAWTSVLWLLVVWEAGVGRAVAVDRNAVASNCSGDVLTWIFTTWDTYGASHLLFLPFRTPADYVTRTVYAHHSQAFLAVLYAVVRLIDLVASKPLYYSINLLPFLQAGVSAVALIALVARDGAFSGERRTFTLVFLFLLLGIVLTQGRFWHDMYTFSSDNPFPFDGAWMVLLLAALLVPARSRLAVAAAAALGAFNPYIAPAVLLALVCMHDRRRAITVGGAMTGAAVAFFFLPRVLINWRGYQTWGSTLLVRSGLDGDTEHFKNIWQAIAAPCPAGCCGGARPLSALLLPAIVPLALAVVLAITDRPTLTSIGRRLAFVAAPYLFSVVLFGQSVSIHPYLYDHLIMTPVLLVGAAALFAPPVQERLKGAVLLCAIFVIAAVLMSNLTGIAQNLAH